MSETGIGYSCELPALHSGPCATFSMPHTVAARDKFEEANPEWRSHPNIGGDIIL